MEELGKLQRDLEKSPKNTALTQKLLKVAREHNLRCASPLVAKHGILVLKHNPSSLGADVWNAYEQVLMACLDTGNIEHAYHCYAKLNAQFPDSGRVQRLEGMIKEAEGDYDGALKVYEKRLEQQEADEHARKKGLRVEGSEQTLGGRQGAGELSEGVPGGPSGVEGDGTLVP